MTPRARRHLLCFLAFLVFIAIAAICDVSVGAWVAQHPFAPGAATHIWHAIKIMGDFRFTLCLALLVLLLTRGNVRAAFLPCLAGIIGGAAYQVLKWCVGRPRPRFGTPFVLRPFSMGLRGLWQAKDLSFPSGHSCLAFATAVALSVSFPRGRVFFMILACLVGLERILEGAHYPSDVAAGVLVGVWSASLAARCWPAPGLQARQSSP